MKLDRDWVFWVFLYLVIMTSAIVILVEIQNIRSMRERENLHRTQDEIKASLDRLEAFVDALKQRDKVRK